MDIPVSEEDQDAINAVTSEEVNDQEIDNTSNDKCAPDSSVIEILKVAQSVLIEGRQLELTDVNNPPEGETNFILIDRNNILETSFDELTNLSNKFIILEVQFYNEVGYFVIYKSINLPNFVVPIIFIINIYNRLY